MTRLNASNASVTPAIAIARIDHRVAREPAHQRRHEKTPSTTPRPAGATMKPISPGGKPINVVTNSGRGRRPSKTSSPPASNRRSSGAATVLQDVERTLADVGPEPVHALSGRTGSFSFGRRLGRQRHRRPAQTAKSATQAPNKTSTPTTLASTGPNTAKPSNWVAVKVRLNSELAASN